VVVALITGASSGIGRELARELATRSYDLVLVARRGDALKALAGDLAGKYGVRTWPIEQDLSEPGGAAALAEKVRGLGLEIGVLVNNAGAGIYGPLNELEDGDIARIITLNYITPILLTKRLLPDLIKARGCVVNVVSLAAHIPIPWFGIYTSTKAALANFTDALRIELRPLGVRVIGVYPGYVRTSFHENTIASPTASRARGSPSTMVLDPAFVARAIAEKIADQRFNGDITPGLAYSIAGALARPLYPLVRRYLDGWFKRTRGSLISRR
jgi:short-subunit dehydrogenase